MTSRPDASRGARLRQWLRRLAACCIACVIAIASAPTFAADSQSDTLRIGSKRFTESYILAQVLAQIAAAQTRTPPQVLQGLGNTAIVYEALCSGNIDLCPEYAGTISLEILKNPAPLSMDAAIVQRDEGGGQCDDAATRMPRRLSRTAAAGKAREKGVINC